MKNTNSNERTFLLPDGTTETNVDKRLHGYAVAVDMGSYPEELNRDGDQGWSLYSTHARLDLAEKAAKREAAKFARNWKTAVRFQVVEAA